MIIDDALNMAYSYAATICQDSELCKVSQEFNGLAGETERTYITKSTTITSYSDIQNLLSKLNEKESVRKSKGVYYTPYDVVRFIVINSVKSAYGKLTPENIRREDIDAVPYKSFAAKKTVFDPTCGAGEYLLAALELKLDLLDKHYKRIPITVIHDTVTSIFGNDINTESIMITKLRIVLCILKRYGVDYIVGLAEKMRPNFLTYDYVVEEPGENKYDIIVGNPPYVEDFKSGLTLSKRYGNIYANVLINDVTLVTVVPLTMLLMRGAAERTLILTLVQETIAANLGSMVTPFGNPQNLYLSSFYGIDTGRFLQLMLPYALLSLGLLLLQSYLIPKGAVPAGGGRIGSRKNEGPNRKLGFVWCSVRRSCTGSAPHSEHLAGASCGDRGFAAS